MTLPSFVMAPGKKYGNVLFIDAYDSFSENIAALICKTLDVQVTMIHIDTRARARKPRTGF
jgi:anthranilate/para-aminobenzoate synthase component II